MKIDITLPNGKFYDIPAKADILLGETFLVTTDGDGTETITSDHDSVLDITEQGTGVKAIAKNVGTSTLRWLNTNDGLIDKITITVYTPATDLGLSADAPTIK